MHVELGSSRIEENPHAASWGAGPVQEVIPQVGEVSFRWRAGSAHTTAANKGVEDLRPRQRRLREDGAHRLPPSSTLHLLTSRSGWDSVRSVTTVRREIEWTLSSCLDMKRVRECAARNPIKQEAIYTME